MRVAVALALALAACGGAKIDLGTLPVPDAGADGAGVPKGAPDPNDKVPPVPDPGPLVDCFREACGTRCSICRPEDPNCREGLGFKACDGKGQCIPKPPLCPTIDGGLEPFYFPCAGLTCGDTCDPCMGPDPSCVRPSHPMHCDVNGACSPQTPLCK